MNIKNKAIFFSISLLSTTTLLVSESFAATGTVTAETVRMREEPTTKSSIILNLDKNDEVDVIEENDGWYRVEFNGETGYVSADYLDVSGDIAGSTSDDNTQTQDNNTTSQDDSNTVVEEEPNENSNQNSEDSNSTVVEDNNFEVQIDQEYTVNKDTNLYILPLVSSIKLGNISANSKVSVKEITNLWAYVSCDLGSGWIIKDVLNNNETNSDEPATDVGETQTDEPDDTSDEPQEDEPSQKSNVGYVNVENVYVRGGPSTDTEPIGSLELNDEVTILGEENNWYRIEYEDTEGYVAEKLISDEKVSNKSTSRGMSRPRGENTVNNIKDIEDNNENSSVTTGAEIVEYAKTFLGAKYVSGGNGPNAFDCSGFTKYVYNHFGYSISRTSGAQANDGIKVGKDELKQGDLLIFLNDSKSRIGHVGIYIGENKFIHAANATRGVVTDSVNNSYYGPRFVEARRILL